MSEDASDVVVVGAGLAGLHAASLLRAGGRSVRVLEARDRVGGRLYSVATPHGAVDLGARFVGPDQPRMSALLRLHGLRTETQLEEGERSFELAGKVQKARKSLPRVSPRAYLDLFRATRRIEGMQSQVPLPQPWESSHAKAWDSRTMATFLAEETSNEEALAALALAVRVLCAREPSQVSVLAFAASLAATGGWTQRLRFREGALSERILPAADELARRLAAKLEGSIVLGAQALAIEQDDRGVRVRTRDRTFAASHAIVAMSPALSARLDYVPALPAPRAQLLSRMPSGAVVCTVVGYGAPFWRRQGLSGSAYGDAGPAQIVFDASLDGGEKAALGVLTLGLRAVELSGCSPAERKSIVLESLAKFFGPLATAPRFYVEKDWSADDLSLGGYLAVPAPGVLMACRNAIRRPAGRIHWAGSETAVEWTGLLEGAAESGERTAQEILQTS